MPIGVAMEKRQRRRHRTIGTELQSFRATMPVPEVLREKTAHGIVAI